MTWIAVEEGAKWGAAAGTAVEPGGGTVVGGIVGGLAGLGAAWLGYKLIANQMNDANTQADDKLKDSTQDEVCASCAKELPCFNTPDKGTPEETDRQLQEQEDKINSMSPDDVLKNMEKFAENGRPNDSAARAEARDTALQRKQTQLRKDYLSQGMDPDEAESQAAADAAEFMKGQDATHALDWIAGGDGSISGTGGRSENRSIGSQWNQPGTGETETRADKLKEAADDAKKQGKKKMNVKLKRC